MVNVNCLHHTDPKIVELKQKFSADLSSLATGLWVISASEDGIKPDEGSADRNLCTIQEVHAHIWVPTPDFVSL